MLANLQFYLFSKGAQKGHFMYERLGNFVQDIREKLGHGS